MSAIVIPLSRLRAIRLDRELAEAERQLYDARARAFRARGSWRELAERLVTECALRVVTLEVQRESEVADG